MSEISPGVRAQIEATPLVRERPLIISDADEVLVAFMAAFERYLEDQGYYFDWSGFRLTGAVRRQSDRELLPAEEVHAALLGFYDECTEKLEPVPGAVEALDALSRRAQVVVLSNLPAAYGAARRRALAAQGMAYPLIVNEGPKGPAVRLLARSVDAPVFFLDDSPNHLKSVADHAADVRLLHFVHDQRLAGLIGPAPASHHRTDTWAEARAVIEDHLAAAGF